MFYATLLHDMKKKTDQFQVQFFEIVLKKNKTDWIVS